MNPKKVDLIPKLLNVTQQDLDLSQVTAIALPVENNDEIKIIDSDLIKSVNSFTKLDLKAEISKWPDFSAKAGELIEIPVTINNLSRIYLDVLS